MIIHDFNPLRTSLSPEEADTILIIDADAALTHSRTCQRFQPIARRRAEFVELFRGV